MTYSEQLAEVRQRVPVAGNMNPVAIARKMHRLGFDISPCEVAKVLSVISGVLVVATKAAPAPRKRRKRKPKTAPADKSE